MFGVFGELMGLYNFLGLSAQADFLYFAKSSHRLPNGRLVSHFQESLQSKGLCSSCGLRISRELVLPDLARNYFHP